MTTWYVRPDTTHSGTRDGTTYATAWGGWSAIVWGVSGVNAGDTLYVCGRHEYSSGISVGAHLGGLGTETIISGELANAPGSLIFSGGAFLTNARSYTNIVGITFQGGTSVCVYQFSGTITGNSYLRNSFIGGTGICLSLDGTTSHVSTTISNNTFSNTLYTGTAGSAINWFVSTSGNAVITDMVISNNTFNSCKGTGNHRAVVHLRIQNDANVLSKITRLTINNNTWKNCTGVAAEINSGFATYAQSSGVRLYNNYIEDITETPGRLGGGFVLWGFGIDSTWATNPVYNNTIKNVGGPTGGFNLFYGTYRVYDNIIDTTYSSTIDGNGILFDFGTQNSSAYRNTVLNAVGRDNAINSGVGIMVLDSTGVTAYGNYINSCKIGVFFGDKAAGQSCTIQNNTFLNCSHYGVYMLSTADQTTCIVRNNIFTGLGNSVTNLGSAWSFENYNCFYLLSAPSGHTFGANTTTTTPNLRYNSPTSSTPNGTSVGYLNDLEKQQYFIPPTIGALQFIPERAAAPSRGVR